MTIQPSTSETGRLADVRVVPEPIRALAFEIARVGEPPWLLGPSLHQHLLRQPPLSWEMSAAVPPEWLLERFPHAVATAAGLRCLTLPTGAGPVDILPRASDSSLTSLLEARTFSIHALALEPLELAWLDPFGGLSAVKEQRLATVRDPHAVLAQDPLVALRAIVLATRSGYRLDSSLAAAFRDTAQRLPEQPRLAIRTLLLQLLASEHPGHGIELLRETGIESALVPGALPDNARLLDRLPADPLLRLAAWLRGTGSDSILARLRLEGAPGRRVSRILRHHPVDALRPTARLEKIARRLDDGDIRALFALREAEIAMEDTSTQATARDRLDRTALRIQKARTQAPRRQLALALDGRDVMAQLACGPGRHVGQALDFLAQCVRNEPACNKPDVLSERLRLWSREHLS